ncbi:MAG: DNA polymerase III subunit gamma/tau, partial [Candidatus Delongbacteria bacterium]|nr:DNA polymerase III subunit gamma/tau [Candidatus Delongbacteria bacterium]
MSYLVLARKFRPQLFAEVVGQDHVTRTLVNAIKHDRIAHAYIFAGPRGVGKTSIARIFSKSLNCTRGPTAAPCGVCDSCRSILDGTNFDVIEIDGASNNSVNDIRDLRGNIQYGPATYNYKIYIIDEVHMLSTGAFNALLKTLEEPPPRTMFIFATTEIHKVPMTILSRCQRFDFHRIPLADMVERLQFICSEEEVEIEEEALFLIARKADGGMRDAQSVLDQLISFSGKVITTQQVVETLGLIQQELFLQFQQLIQKRDFDATLRFVHDLVFKGYDLVEFLHGLAEHFRHLLTV